ncbi:MAG: hypothetical protein JXR07_10825 [Reichenbachiella sp.]
MIAMNGPDVNRYILFAGLLLITVSSSFLSEKEKLKYTQNATIALGDEQKPTLVVAFSDTLDTDSLYLVKTKEGVLVHYFKNIQTEVCFDQECRLLEITVYWNVTGRYLGFELPKGEFLSKHNHEPFIASEYERLNDLLANPNLPLGHISFEKLITLPESKEESIDGVSGATTQEVSKMVVKGAAYTTYTLWNAVYGPSKDRVQQITAKYLDAHLAVLILGSPVPTDKIWVLDRIDQSVPLDPALEGKFIDLVSGEDYYLAYTTINTISKVHLGSDTLQLGLFWKYEKANHSIQKMLVQKLMEAPHLNPQIVANARSLLNQLNGRQLGDMLGLFSNHDVYDSKTLLIVSEILKTDNRFVSGQAYKYLEDSNTSDEAIVELMNNYISSRRMH